MFIVTNKLFSIVKRLNEKNQMIDKQIEKIEVTFITKTITRSLIMLNTIMENENTSSTNILIPFLRSCSHH